MRRKWKGVAAVVAAVGLSGAMLVSLLAPASSARAPRNPGDSQISVFDVEGPFERDVDLGDPGFGPGDLVFEIQPLIDPVDESPVGQVYTRLQVMRVLKTGDFVFVIDCQVKLSAGTILFNGTGKFSGFSSGAVFPVTGGTGSYELARGTVTGTAGSVGGKDGATLTFDLTTT